MLTLYGVPEKVEMTSGLEVYVALKLCTSDRILYEILHRVIVVELSKYACSSAKRNVNEQKYFGENVNDQNEEFENCRFGMITFFFCFPS